MAKNAISVARSSKERTFFFDNVFTEGVMNGALNEIEEMDSRRHVMKDIYSNSIQVNQNELYGLTSWIPQNTS